MTFEIRFEEKAINRLAGYPADDAQGVEQILQVIDALADEPRPAGSFTFGSPDLRRLRVGRYRVLDEVQGGVVSVGYVARGRAFG